MKGSYGRYALLGALICALLAAWFNFRFLEARERKTEVVMVVKEVMPYTAIPADALRIEAVPAEAVPRDALTDPLAMEGRYSRALLIPGTILRSAHLVAANGSNLAARLAAAEAPDMRAMALKVNEATGVAGTLKEGDPVDVLVAVQAERGEETTAARLPAGTLSRVIAQRVPVLFVQTEQEGPATVVLQVTPKTAEEIAFAQANGQIWLLTSPYGQEDEPVATTGVDQQVFFERYGVGETQASTVSLAAPGNSPASVAPLGSAKEPMEGSRSGSPGGGQP